MTDLPDAGSPNVSLQLPRIKDFKHVRHYGLLRRLVAAARPQLHGRPVVS